jgi:hypothetical protein
VGVQENLLHVQEPQNHHRAGSDTTWAGVLGNQKRTTVRRAEENLEEGWTCRQSGDGAGG